MAIDEALAHRVRVALAGCGTVREIKMFGGIGFMLNGNMIAGTSDRGLLVRVGKKQHAAALKRAGARAMIMRGRKLEGYIRVDSSALSPRTIESWLKLARKYVDTLPRKTLRRRPRSK